MIRGVFALMGLGLFLCFMGYEQYQEAGEASAEPHEVNLVQLEYGMDPPDKHIMVQDHAAVFAHAIYSCIGDFAGEPGDDVRVQTVYYPVVSMSHPYIQRLMELDSQGQSLLDADLLSFRMLVKTKRFDTVGSIPDSVDLQESLQGLVAKRGSDLGISEQRLLIESFPELDLDELLIVHADRQPASPGSYLGLIALGGLMIVGGGGLLAFSSWE